MYEPLHFTFHSYSDLYQVSNIHSRTIRLILHGHQLKSVDPQKASMASRHLPIAQNCCGLLRANCLLHDFGVWPQHPQHLPTANTTQEHRIDTLVNPFALTGVPWNEAAPQHLSTFDFRIVPCHWKLTVLSTWIQDTRPPLKSTLQSMLHFLRC